MDIFQIMETSEKPLDIIIHFPHIHITKHIFPNEIGDTIHFFHGNSLLEQVQCIFLLDAKKGFEPYRIGCIVIEQFHIGDSFQSLFQVRDVISKATKILLDRQCFFSHHKETSRFVTTRSEIKHLRQSHKAVRFGITKDRQNDGIFIFISKSHWLFFP